MVIQYKEGGDYAGNEEVLRHPFEDTSDSKDRGCQGEQQGDLAQSL